MNTLSTVLSALVYAPVALILAPVAAVVWLAEPVERRIELANEHWQLREVVLAQASAVG